MSHRRHRAALVSLLVLHLALAACGTSSTASDESVVSAAADVVAKLPVVAETRATPGTQPNDAAFWPNPADPSATLLLGASGDGGLEIFNLDGKKVGGYPGAHLDHIDVSRAFPLHGAAQSLVVGYDRNGSQLLAFTLDPASFAVTPVSARPLEVGSDVTGLCTYRSPRTGTPYVFAVTGKGEIQQWALFEREGKVDGAIVRTLPAGVGAGYCAVDEHNAQLYVTEETVGIWKLPAEPESDAERELVDLVGPRGHLAEEVKGIAVYAPDATHGYLLATDVAAGRINVYSTNHATYVGTFSAAAPQGARALHEAEGLEITSTSLGSGMQSGALVVADEVEGAPAANFRLLAWSAISSQLKLPAAAASSGPAVTPKNVMPSVETDPVDDDGDAADDPALWVHPTDPARSVIIGAQKKRGLYVYDLAGKTLQVLPDGRMNNVDLRHGFMLGGAPVAIVAASNRTTRTLALYKIDPASRRLVNVAEAPVPTGFNDPYGLCMYRSARTGDFFVFMNDADSGAYKQWRLVAKGNKLAAELVREFTVGSQAEGCAADDETGALYIAEEDVGLWRYEADPSGADRRTPLDKTGEGGHLEADVEGVAVYYGAQGAGYLIVSNQGNDNFAVYRREGRNEFLGHFSVIADPKLGIDGASETDGLDVISTPLGLRFPYGAFIAQDGRNIAPMERQNFKLVPWERVADALSLDKFTGWNPNRTR